MQQTLKDNIIISGTGLHSGLPVQLCLRPAVVGHGVVFKRLDVTDRCNLIPADYRLVYDTRMCTALRNHSGVCVNTVEHLMAAFAGTGLNNVLVEINSAEVPIMDGSAATFVNKILRVGVKVQNAPLWGIRVLQPIVVNFACVRVALLPLEGFAINFSINFTDSAIGQQSKNLNMVNGAFVRELSDSRTFCALQDAKNLQAIGLGLGGDLTNAIIVDDGVVLNPEGFRHHDECVRHKMLDAIGDLYLSGGPILAQYVGHRAGHRATNMVLHALFNNHSAWERIKYSSELACNLLGADIQAADCAF